MATQRQGGTANREGRTRILPFALPLTGIPTEAAPLPKCPWCHHPFEAVKKNQVFCKPGHRREACERRKAEGIKTLAAYFLPFGLSQKHIEDCAETLWPRCRKVLETLNYHYDELGKQWVKV